MATRKLQNISEPKQKPSLWDFSQISLLTLGKRLASSFNGRDVLGNAAKLAYYFLLSVFPMLLAVLAIMGILAGGNPHFRELLFQNLAHVMPGSASDLVGKTINETAKSSSGTTLVFGIRGT